MSDASCYESHLRFPTNDKLLFECIVWLYEQIMPICQTLKIRRPRSKYTQNHQRYLHFSRSRKKTYKKKKKLHTSLIYLLGKLKCQLSELERKYRQRPTLSASYYKRRNIINTVLEQHRQMYQSGKSVPDRIVSVHKPYIRPIVQGKETKAVEFGAKANLVQVGGLNFIEHI